MPLNVGRTSTVTPDTRVAASLKSLVPEAWRTVLGEAIDAPSFKSLDEFVTSEESTQSIFPPRAQIFAALGDTPPSKVKVVIIGQDPYPTKGNANGLAFSVSPGMKVPGSLQNIYKGLNA